MYYDEVKTMTQILIVRRWLLVIAGVAFLAIAVGALVSPRTMAEPIGFRLDTANALNEFRAVYVGLWIAHAILFFWAARRVDRLVLGDVGGLLIAGQVLGRLVSLALDGWPDPAILATGLAEAAGAALILLMRPRGG